MHYSYRASLKASTLSISCVLALCGSTLPIHAQTAPLETRVALNQSTSEPLPADPALAPLTDSIPLLAANTVNPANPVAPSLTQKEASADSASAPSMATAKPSQSLTVNLINRMVQRGMLSKEDASDLLKQAEADTAQAQAHAAAEQKSAIETAVNQALAKANLEPTSLEPSATEDSMHVTYIPEMVKQQMRDEIKEEVMAQAREEHWVAPNSIPGWVTRFRLTGDIRIRGEGAYFPDGNDNTGAFPDFNKINTGAPFDVTGSLFSPQLNVDQERYRVRLRARVGAEVDLGDNFSAGLRVATGENNSPVSTNQSFGLANQGQGGNFSKYSLWLDRAFIKYELGAQSSRDFSLSAGRMDNPFFGTSEIVWDDDLGFDGFAAHGHYEVLHGFTPFLNGGAFPVFNTDFNFANNQPQKYKSTDKWLYGIQGGSTWNLTKDLELKTAVAYYHFDGVEGKLSSPFTPLSASDQGDTDNTRPSFAQKGNTYRPLRRIVPTADNGYGTTNQWQYFGLATPFHELALSGRLNYNHFEPFQVSLFGDYVQNLAFNSSDVGAIAINNRGATASGSAGPFVGGNTGWIVGFKVGHAAFQKCGDWSLGFNYRYVESDAVVDGLTDSDFGLGGTNLKGYSINGAVALSPRVSLGLRWMSADSIAGAPFKSDIIQADLNAKF
jgi:hypothetical protein